MMKESKKGKLNTILVKEYDKDDYIIKEKKINIDGSIVWEKTYKYNQKDKKGGAMM